MITAAVPGFLWAGAALAVVPIILHLLYRRPPLRLPLPTAAFVVPDPRTSLRFRRRPSDPLLLLLRVLLALTLGCAFAGLAWSPSRSGTSRLVLLDGGAGMAPYWDQAVAVATEAAGPDGRVFVYGSETAPLVIPSSSLQTLSTGSAESTYEAGLRALRQAFLAHTRLDSAHVTWVTRSRWGAWPGGFALLRPHLWPGRIAVETVGPVRGGPETGGPESGPGGLPATLQTPGNGGAIGEPLADSGGAAIPVALLAADVGRFVPAALQVSGWTIATEGDANAVRASPPPALIVGTDPLSDLLVDRVRGGATAIVSGPLSGTVGVVPWDLGQGAATAGAGALVLPWGRRLGSDSDPLPGGPRPGSRILAAWENGVPAAAAERVAAGCVVYAALDLSDPVLGRSPLFPELVRTLAHGCDDGDAPADVPLDRAGVEVLASSGLDSVVSARDLTASLPGRPLARWLALAALLLAIAETWVARTGGRRAR